MDYSAMFAQRYFNERPAPNRDASRLQKIIHIIRTVRRDTQLQPNEKAALLQHYNPILLQAIQQQFLPRLSRLERTEPESQQQAKAFRALRKQEEKVRNQLSQEAINLYVDKNKGNLWKQFSSQPYYLLTAFFMATLFILSMAYLIYRSTVVHAITHFVLIVSIAFHTLEMIKCARIPELYWVLPTIAIQCAILYMMLGTEADFKKVEADKAKSDSENDTETDQENKNKFDTNEENIQKNRRQVSMYVAIAIFSFAITVSRFLLLKQTYHKPYCYSKQWANELFETRHLLRNPPSRRRQRSGNAASERGRQN